MLAYAMAVWAVAVVYRRRWQSFVAVALSVIPAAAATQLVVAYTGRLPEGPYTWLYSIGIAYTGLILGIGLLIAVQPRKRPDVACALCAYDVHGLAGACPECGHDLALPASSAARRERRARLREAERGGAAFVPSPGRRTHAGLRAALAETRG